MPGKHAPIAFFAFNRPEHAARTLAALAANAEAIDTDLHVFVDGARNDAEQPLVAEVVRIAQTAAGFHSVRIKHADTNQGLYRAITSGVSAVFSEAGRVIVVEDDILVSPHFLAYMNDALERYASDPRVASIHAYSPPIAGLPDYFFLRGGDCWGWATWADRWTLFNPDASGLLDTLVSRKLLTEFCASHGSRSLLLLARRVRGRNQSWAILWHASLFLAGRYTLHPGQSFVQNIGNDGSGAHAANTSMHATPLTDNYTRLPELAVEDDPVAAARLSRFLDSGNAINRLVLRSYAKLAARFPFLMP
jgi:hypothetical protein